MARRKKSSATGWLVLMAVLAFGVAAAVTYYLVGDWQSPTAPRPKPRIKPPVVTQVPLREVTIYIPETSGDRFYLAPSVRKTDKKGKLVDVAMEVLLETAGEQGEAGKLIPKGTKLLSPVQVRNRVATVNLSKEFVANFSGGSTQEGLTLNSIAHTLVDNSEGSVDRVQILVEGSKIETLGGHFEISGPFSADSTLLKQANSD